MSVLANGYTLTSGHRAQRVSKWATTTIPARGGAAVLISSDTRGAPPSCATFGFAVHCVLAGLAVVSSAASAADARSVAARLRRIAITAFDDAARMLVARDGLALDGTEYSERVAGVARNTRAVCCAAGGWFRVSFVGLPAGATTAVRVRLARLGTGLALWGWKADLAQRARSVATVVPAAVQVAFTWLGVAHHRLHSATSAKASLAHACGRAGIDPSSADGAGAAEGVAYIGTASLALPATLTQTSRCFGLALVGSGSGVRAGRFWGAAPTASATTPYESVEPGEPKQRHSDVPPRKPVSHVRAPRSLQIGRAGNTCNYVASADARESTGRNGEVDVQNFMDLVGQSRSGIGAEPRSP